MEVIIEGCFVYTAEFFIKEEAYAKLISAAETSGKDSADAMLGHYLENYAHDLKSIGNKYILKMLKESTMEFRTFFPSNHVTISVYGPESLVDIDPCLKESWEWHQDIAALFAREFKFKPGILEFISGELDCGNIVGKDNKNTN